MAKGHSMRLIIFLLISINTFSQTQTNLILKFYEQKSGDKVYKIPAINYFKQSKQEYIDYIFDEYGLILSKENLHRVDIEILRQEKIQRTLYAKILHFEIVQRLNNTRYTDDDIKKFIELLNSKENEKKRKKKQKWDRMNDTFNAYDSSNDFKDGDNFVDNDSNDPFLLETELSRMNLIKLYEFALVSIGSTFTYKELFKAVKAVRKKLDKDPWLIKIKWGDVIDREVPDSEVGNIELSKYLTPKFFKNEHGIDVLLNFGILKRIEEEFHNDHNGAHIALRAIFNLRPFHSGIRSRISVTEGVAYEREATYSENIYYNDESSRFSNYFELSFDLNLKDIFPGNYLNRRMERECYLGIAYTNRAQFDFEESLNEGSAYIECTL